MSWLLGGERIEVSADVDIEKSPLSFHAHAVPDGIDIQPGDTVLVYGLPSTIGSGETLVCRTTATVIRG